MKTVQVPALEILQAANPYQKLGALFGLDANDADSLTKELTQISDNVLCEVFDWEECQEAFEDMILVLETAQQHSSTFYLLWGTRDDLVNIHADGSRTLLENPPLDAKSSQYANSSR